MDQSTSNARMKAVNDEAAAWVVRLNAGKPTREDAFAFEDWLNESELHRAAFKRMSGVWLDAGRLFDPRPVERAEPISLRRTLGSWARIHPRSAWGGLAGACLTIVVAAWVLLDSGPLSSRTGAERLELRTAVGESRRVQLEDGSVIQLNTKTELTTDFTGTDRVVVLLGGEAHFTVASDTLRPFRVYTGRSMVEAVGTAFRVRLEDDATEVTVTEGKVRLARLQGTLDADDPVPPEPEATVAMVAAGRNAVFDRERISVEEIDAQTMAKKLSWQNGMLVFDGDTLAVAVHEFERYTSTRILIRDDAIRNTRIVGYFSAGDTEKFLHALQASFDIVATPGAAGVIELRRKSG